MSELSDRDLISVANRAVSDFEHGLASPWRLVGLLKILIERLAVRDDR